MFYIKQSILNACFQNFSNRKKLSASKTATDEDKFFSCAISGTSNLMLSIQIKKKSIIFIET